MEPLTAGEAAEIRRSRIHTLRADGETYKRIAEREGVSQTRVIELDKRYMREATTLVERAPLLLPYLRTIAVDR